jgi:repressor LexA
MAERKDVPENRVRRLRKERGLTLEQLGDMVGVHFTTIAKIERSQRRLSGALLHNLAQALAVDPSELVENVPQSVPVRLVPVVGKIAAGNWKEAVRDPDGFVPAPVRGGFCFALRPDGDSMNLVVGTDAVVIVDPEQLDLLDGRLYALANGEGETTFKRFRADPPRLEPVSSNPEHKVIPLGREAFTVIGRIIWQGSFL